MDSDLCPDCGARTDGSYCSACGQRVDVDPRSLLTWTKEAMEEVLSFDGRFPRSLWAVVTRPGHLTVEWREGRRTSWMSPFRLYLFASLVFFTASVVLPASAQFSVGNLPFSDPAMSAAVRAAQAEALAATAPQVLILMVPVLALILRVGFGGRLFFVEHLVHAVHLQSFLFLLFLLVFLGDPLPGVAAPFFGLALLIGLLAYVTRSCMRVYGVGVVRAALTVIGASVPYFVATMLGLAVAVTVTQDDPLQAVHEAEEDYWSLRERWSTGDTTLIVVRAQTVATRYLRLEAHLLDPTVRAHAAELLVAGDSVRDGRALVEWGLASRPDDALLLRVAVAAAWEVGDTAAVRRYSERLLSAPDPPDLDERHRSDLAEARARAGRFLER